MRANLRLTKNSSTVQSWLLLSHPLSLALYIFLSICQSVYLYIYLLSYLFFSLFLSQFFLFLRIDQNMHFNILRKSFSLTTLSQHLLVRFGFSDFLFLNSFLSLFLSVFCYLFLYFCAMKKVLTVCFSVLVYYI